MMLGSTAKQCRITRQRLMQKMAGTQSLSHHVERPLQAATTLSIMLGPPASAAMLAGCRFSPRDLMSGSGLPIWRVYRHERPLTGATRTGMNVANGEGFRMPAIAGDASGRG